MSWKETTISVADSDHFETLNGLWKGKKEPFVEAGVIRNTNFTPSGVIDYSNVAYLDVEEKQLSKRLLEAGDIILERSGGGPKQPVGRVVFFDREDGAFSFSNFTSAVRVRDKDTFDPRFVFYGLMELYQSGQTEDIQRRTTGIRNLDFTAYKERARFPKITLPEQKKIAHILSTVQRAIEAQERIIQTTTELKEALMHKLFTEGLRSEPQKQTEIGPVPESWDLIRCEDACGTTSVGIVVKPTQYYVPTGVPALRSQNVRVDQMQMEPMVYISEEANDGPVAKSKLRTGDVLIVRTGANLGMSCVLPAELDGCNCIDLLFIRTNPDRLNGSFLSRFINSVEAKKQVGAGKTGMAQPHFNVGTVKRIFVPLPPLGEQDEIVTCLEKIDQKHDLAKAKQSALQDLFRTLLRELMTAKTRVPSIELLNTKESLV